MSLFEWFFERRNPGPVGKIKINQPDTDDGDPPKKWRIWLAFIVGLAFTAFCVSVALYRCTYVPIQDTILKLAFLSLYITISHLVTVEPNLDNLGWAGGFFDNPFRVSDDFNRWLLFFQALLFPGKLMAFSLIMSWIFIRRIWKKRH